jgi:plastocyanin
VRLPRRFLGSLGALLGAAVVVLPAVASSEMAPTTIQAENKPGGGYYGETHAWSPAQVTVSAGAAVTLSNPSAEVKHGVEWTGGPTTPSCSGVPVGTNGTKWTGTCTFSQPGTYTFRCTVHPKEMTGTITVNANGATTPSEALSPSGGPATTAPTTSAESGLQTTSGSTGSPLAGSASKALKLASLQHGGSVHGSIKVSRGGAGGRLEVDLLATSASLAKAVHSVQVRVGRLVRSSLRVGTVSFAVPLSAEAKRALRRRHRLALSVRIVLKPLGGSAVTLARSVIVHS